METDVSLFISCEHAGNRVPEMMLPLFRGADDVLATHRGWDIGILPVARSVSQAFGVRLYYSCISRLVADLNRSKGHPNLFSEYTRHLSRREKDRVLDRYYHPYRRRITSDIRNALNFAPVVHVALHSFTPELNGEVRNADIGILYDPKNPGETRFARAWQEAIRESGSELRVRRNYPYEGRADSLPTALRRLISEGHGYIGIEIEVNQAILGSKQGRAAMAGLLCSTLGIVLRRMNPGSRGF